MSCIVSVCYSDYCTIMGDGRLLNFTEKFPRVESETFRKVIKFNSYVCMGFTGDPLPVVRVDSDFKDIVNDDIRLEEVHDFYIDHIVNQTEKHGDVQLIFSGKTKDGVYQTYQTQITKDNKSTQQVFVPDHSIAVVYSPPLGTDISKIIEDNLSSQLPRIKDIRKIQFAMGVCIIKTAEINPSVNKNLYFVEASDRIQDNCKTYNLIIKDT